MEDNEEDFVLEKSNDVGNAIVTTAPVSHASTSHMLVLLKFMMPIL